MPGTFSQIYIQIVFAVKGRSNLVLSSFEEDVLQIHCWYYYQQRAKNHWRLMACRIIYIF